MGASVWCRMTGGGAVVIDGNVISGCVSGGQSAGKSGGAGTFESVFKASWEENPDAGSSIFRRGSGMGVAPMSHAHPCLSALPLGIPLFPEEEIYVRKK